MRDGTDKPGEVSTVSDAAAAVSAADDAVARVISTDDGEIVASVAATAEGAIVARIEELAAKYDIPLVQDAMLTNLLTKVPSGDQIPDNVYCAISEVLCCVYDVIDSEDKTPVDG